MTKNIEVKVNYLGLLRDITRKKEEVLFVEEGVTIRDIINILSDAYGESFTFSILSAKGDIRPDITLAYNSNVLNEANALDRKLSKDGDNLQILVAGPAFPGG